MICEHSFRENLNSKRATHTQSGLTTFNTVKEVKDGLQLIPCIFLETFLMDDDDASMILTLLGSAYLSVSKDQGGAHCAPHLEMILCGMIYHIKKDS